MRADEVVACAKDAFHKHGTPSIMNSDQGSVFGSDAYVALLADHHVTQSMDGRVRWRDNALWRGGFAHSRASTCAAGNTKHPESSRLDQQICRLLQQPPYAPGTGIRHTCQLVPHRHQSEGGIDRRGKD